MSSAVENGLGFTFSSIPCGFTKRVRSIFNCLANAFIWLTKAITGVTFESPVAGTSDSSVDPT